MCHPGRQLMTWMRRPRNSFERKVNEAIGLIARRRVGGTLPGHARPGGPREGGQVVRHCGGVNERAVRRAGGVRRIWAACVGATRDRPPVTRSTSPRSTDPATYRASTTKNAPDGAPTHDLCGPAERDRRSGNVHPVRLASWLSQALCGSLINGGDLTLWRSGAWIEVHDPVPSLARNRPCPDWKTRRSLRTVRIRAAWAAHGVGDPRQTQGCAAMGAGPHASRMHRPACGRVRLGPGVSEGLR